MPKIDMTDYIEQHSIRKVAFGGCDQEDVRQTLYALSAEYEQLLQQTEADAQTLQQENDALQRHCQTLTAQNQKLTAQNTALTAGGERSAQQLQELQDQLASLRDRNRLLNDQVAVLKLQNGDLTRENAGLQDTAAQAEATLRLKGEALDKDRDALRRGREEKLEQTRREAGRILEAARAQTQDILARARQDAEAIEDLARGQAREQARRFLEATAAEATEVQNAHQLRLNDLRTQVDAMESRRDKLSAYLARVGSELLNLEQMMKVIAPAETEPAPAEPPALEVLSAPEPELDLSAETVAGAVEQTRAEEGLPPLDTAPMELKPEPDAPAPRMPFTLVEDAAPADEPPAARRDPSAAKPVEVPGAIFSYPIREDAALPEEEAPSAAPHRPVMPVLADDDEEDPMPHIVPGPAQSAAPEPVKARPVQSRAAALKRKKAVRAVRALRRRLS